MVCTELRQAVWFIPQIYVDVITHPLNKFSNDLLVKKCPYNTKIEVKLPRHLYRMVTTFWWHRCIRISDSVIKQMSLDGFGNTSIIRQLSGIYCWIHRSSTHRFLKQNSHKLVVRRAWNQITHIEYSGEIIHEYQNSITHIRKMYIFNCQLVGLKSKRFI